LSVVVDSSVVVAALVDTGGDGNWAEEILESGSLYAPELIRAEVANVLRRLQRAKQITEPEAYAAYEDFMQLDLELHAFEAFSDRVWELRHSVASYDAWYVAIAEALDLPLATLDKRLVNADGPKCRFFTPGAEK
jgi:predicted nucleic acid-binding protein